MVTDEFGILFVTGSVIEHPFTAAHYADKLVQGTVEEQAKRGSSADVLRLGQCLDVLQVQPFKFEQETLCAPCAQLLTAAALALSTRHGRVADWLRATFFRGSVVLFIHGLDYTTKHVTSHVFYGMLTTH